MNWFGLAYAATGLALAPFGTLPDLNQAQTPWRGFASEDPVLFVARAEKIKSSDCQAWMNALDTEALGTPFKLSEVDHKDISFLEETWAPWEEEEREIVEECTSSPCKVKLDSNENSKVSEAPGKERFKLYLKLIRARVQDYMKTRKHRGYEYPEPPFDHWEYFKRYKFLPETMPNGKSQLWIRKFDFGSNRARDLHQILDKQAVRDPSGKGITVWIRDVYTDHYFDGWGEWLQVQCDSPEKGQLTFIHVLALELDLLKKTDLFSRMARGSMRSTIKTQGTLYLDRRFERVRARVQR